MPAPGTKLYVGCSLTHAPEEEKRFVEEVKEELRKEYAVLEFVGLGEGPAPEDIYRHDIEACVGECSAFVAFCNLPSLGLGYEIATAVEKRGIPVLALAHKDARVTRLIRGVTHPRYSFKTYDSKEAALSLIRAFITANAE